MAREIMLMMLGWVARIGMELGFPKVDPQDRLLDLLEDQVTDLLPYLVHGQMARDNALLEGD
jgi:hypothetical protein